MFDIERLCDRVLNNNDVSPEDLGVLLAFALRPVELDPVRDQQRLDARNAIRDLIGGEEWLAAEEIALQENS